MYMIFLRYYTNPTYWIYNIGKYVGETYSSQDMTMKKIAQDAKKIYSKNLAVAKLRG